MLHAIELNGTSIRCGSQKEINLLYGEIIHTYLLDGLYVSFPLGDHTKARFFSRDGTLNSLEIVCASVKAGAL